VWFCHNLEATGLTYLTSNWPCLHQIPGLIKIYKIHSTFPVIMLSEICRRTNQKSKIWSYNSYDLLKRLHHKETETITDLLCFRLIWDVIVVYVVVIVTISIITIIIFHTTRDRCPCCRLLCHITFTSSSFFSECDFCNACAAISSHIMCFYHMCYS